MKSTQPNQRYLETDGLRSVHGSGTALNASALHRLKFWILALGTAAMFFGATGSQRAEACALESALGFEAFAVSHTGAISVAIATRKAVEAGDLVALPEYPTQRRRFLARIGHKARQHMAALAQRGVSGPPFFVLLTQTGAWMHMNDPVFGARYHVDQPASEALTILLPDTAYAELLSGTMIVGDLMERGLLRVAGEGNHADAVAAFAQGLDAT